MPSIPAALRDHVLGPGRAVLVLAGVEILAWGVLIYSPVLMLPHLAAARGWSLAACMGGFSLALVVSGLVAPTAGHLIERHGGNAVMSAGALAGAAGLAGLTIASHPLAYALCWILLGAAMASTLYDPAFTTLTRIFGMSARRQITFVTFAGGFASTVLWPATHTLLGLIDWRATYLVFAAVFAFVMAPLLMFALPRERTLASAAAGAAASAPPRVHKPEGRVFVLITIGFAMHALILSGLTSNWLAMMARDGLPPALIVTIGALFGPAQVAARLVDFASGGRIHPLWIARGALATMAAAFALLATTGIVVPAAILFTVAFGAANGVMSIARGALPLALFGSVGYGRTVGRIARPAQFVQALAPFVAASALERLSDRAVLLAGCACALTAVACFAAMRRP